jgi:hypothetical protein
LRLTGRAYREVDLGGAITYLYGASGGGPAIIVKASAATPAAPIIIFILFLPDAPIFDRL